MKVKVTVVYPVTFEYDIGDANLKDAQQVFKIKDKILEEADKVYESSSIDSVIHECTESETGKTVPEIID